MRSWFAAPALHGPRLASARRQGHHAEERYAAVQRRLRDPLLGRRARSRRLRSRPLRSRDHRVGREPAHLIGQDIRHLMAQSIEARFDAGTTRVAHPVEWLSDNGPPYTAHVTREWAATADCSFARRRRTRPNRTAWPKPSLRTFKRDYVYLAELHTADAVLRAIAAWFDDYNEHHPHSGQGMRSPVSSALTLPDRKPSTQTCSLLRGQLQLDGSDRSRSL
jgi:transposase InsO family protein